MKRTKNGRRRFSREFKVAAIKRVQAGEKQVRVAEELEIGVVLLARWRRQYRHGAEAALGEIGRPTSVKLPDTRVGELERLAGRQQAAIDFLEQALHRVEELRRKKRGNGVTAS